MATLDPPVLPPYLYRYRKLTTAEELDQVLRTIREGELFCAPYRDLNDAMEGFYEPTSRVERNTNYSRVVKEIMRAKSAIGVCCFSDVHDNELMWAHYTNNYRGICIGYSPKELMNGLPRHYHLVRMSYGLEPPLVTSVDAESARAAARKILSHKKSSWVYEREWRIIGPQGSVRISSDNCIRDVYVGSNLLGELRSELLWELEGLPFRISSMKVAGYSHDWKEIQDLKGKKIFTKKTKAAGGAAVKS